MHTVCIRRPAFFTCPSKDSAALSRPARWKWFLYSRAKRRGPLLVRCKSLPVLLSRSALCSCEAGVYIYLLKVAHTCQVCVATRGRTPSGRTVWCHSHPFGQAALQERCHLGLCLWWWAPLTIADFCLQAMRCPSLLQATFHGQKTTLMMSGSTNSFAARTARIHLDDVIFEDLLARMDLFCKCQHHTVLFVQHGHHVPGTAKTLVCVSRQVRSLVVGCFDSQTIASSQKASIVYVLTCRSLRVERAITQMRLVHLGSHGALVMHTPQRIVSLRLHESTATPPHNPLSRRWADPSNHSLLD